MTSKTTRRSTSLVFALIISFLLGACTLTGSPEQSLDLTDVPTNTVQPTRTPAGSAGLPTSRPTVTSLPLQQPQQPTRSVILPPTAVPPAQASTPVPISIVILSPVPGSVISGNTQVLGAASHPQFLQYQVEYGPQPNSGNLWFPITGTVQRPVNNGLLGIWNTTSVEDGLYNIRLRVTLRDGTSLSTVVGNIRVQNRQPTPIPTATTIPRPIAAFSQSATAGQVPLVVNFFNQSQGEITGYQWSFGDGGSSSEINPTYTYRNPGIYTVILTANGPGGSSNVSRQITVQSVSPPVAAFTQDRVSGESPLVVQFTDQSTGNITSREWRFGDGATSTEQNPSHTFTEVGTYNVILSVQGSGGATSAIRQITVENPSVPAPDAAFTASTTSGELPLQVEFSPTSTDNINTYDWRVEGVTFSNNAQSQFTFTEAGAFTVELIVTGDGGQDTNQETITITRPPDAPDVSISVNPESGDVPLSVQFTSESVGGEITSYTWDLGDGNFSNEASPAYTYTGQGTYDVTLVVEGPGGTDTETLSVTAVDPVQPPQAAFDAIVVDDGVGLTVDFINGSTGEGLTYAWQFGDGNTSADESPQHTYANYGTYTVAVSVTNSAGSSTAETEITLSAPLTAVTAIASAAPLQAAVGDTIQFDSSGSSGDIATYTWDFGDGNTSDQPSPTNSYQTEGEFTATLSLVGQDGSTSSDTVTINVGAGLQAAFTPQQANVTAGESVTFDSSGSTGAIVSYAWQFGDGGTSAEANPTYPYNAPGEYQVTLTISDGATQSTATGTVSVGAGLQAAFTPQQANVTAGESVTFD
ncbi:MAG: PKD domain-containing protein, partial [Chloroflexota bacterium]